MNKILLILSLFLLVGCAKPSIEYIEVLVPVKSKIEKPVRPIYKESDSTFTYLPELLNYTRLLESTIDIHNESIDERR